MKKGFTLIELLGVVAILAIIVMVAIPAFIESNNAAQANEEEDFNKTIEMATNDYINSCSSLGYCADGEYDSLFASNSTATISTSKLIEAGFLDEDLEDPDGKTVKNKNVKVTSNNGKLTVTYGG